MKRPSFQVGSKVKVITHDYEEYLREHGVEHNVNMYGWRGEVVNISGFDNDWNYIPTPYAPENYPTNWQIDVNFVSPINGDKVTTSFRNWETELETIQKKFIDIDYLREDDLEIGEKPDGTKLIRPANSKAFEVGDIIQITTKIDGANASISWDETTGKLEIFSRTNLLSPTNDLRGFYNYIKTVVEPKTDWSEFKNLVFFGEWCIKHTIKYNDDWYGKWRVYDIWSKKYGRYLDQRSVRMLCNIIGLEYIEELYCGPFISWEHCRSFMNKSAVYGPDQEGIVVKNQTALFRPENRFTAYLKIVNESFKETMAVKSPKKSPKKIDPEVEAARQKAFELAESVVTEARVKKIILKLIDEGILPETLEPKDMGLVMKHLPKRVYEDIVKEESEVLEALAENAGKCIAAETAKVARKIIINS